MATKKVPLVHPGEVLREDFLVPMKLSPYAVARGDRRAAHKDRAVGARRDADTALRLARYFRTTAAFWMGMKAHVILNMPKMISRQICGK